MTNSSLPIEERERKPPSPNPLGIGLPSPEQLAKPADKSSKPDRAIKGEDLKKKQAPKASKRKEASSSSSSSSSSSKEPANKKAKPTGAAEPQKVIVQIQTK